MVEHASPPPFDAKGCRYDQTTYSGRLRRFREMTDPRMLLIGDEELANAQHLLDEHAMGRRCASDAELWEAKRIKDAIIHPVTGEKMFLPGRMSAFVLVNTPTTVGKQLHYPLVSKLSAHHVSMLQHDGVSRLPSVSVQGCCSPRPLRRMSSGE